MVCPHCIGAGCIHCYDRRLEQRRLARQHSRLTQADRRRLGIFTAELVPADTLKAPVPVHAPRPHKASPLQCVLPAGFTLQIP